MVHTARTASTRALDDAHVARLEMPACELYPDGARRQRWARACGAAAARHPSADSGRRYALFDEYGLPCAFTSTEAALRFVLAWPNGRPPALARPGRQIRRDASDAGAARSAAQLASCIVPEDRSALARARWAHARR